MSNETSQDKIWSHFQNIAPESFAAARPRLNYLLRRIRNLAAGRSPAVLNIGIGDGYLERQAIDLGWQIVSVDPDEKAVSRLSELGVQGMVGVAERLPLPDQSVEFVVASEVLEHLTDSQRSAAIGEIARVLKRPGWFLGTVPYNENLAEQQTVCPHCGIVFHRWGHHASFTLEDMRSQLAAQFEVQELRRTAFVQFRGRNLLGKAKSAVRLILAQAGQPIAVPSIFWLASVRKET